MWWGGGVAGDIYVREKVGVWRGVSVVWIVGSCLWSLGSNGPFCGRRAYLALFVVDGYLGPSEWWHVYMPLGM